VGKRLYSMNKKHNFLASKISKLVCKFLLKTEANRHERTMYIASASERLQIE
jgi:hypothetical protein